MTSDYINTLLIQLRQRELQEHLQRREWLRQISTQHKRRHVLSMVLNLIGSTRSTLVT
jgi:hypothetical protein